MRDANLILEDWYAGEIGGEALFWGLAERSTPEGARKWLALAQVESRVGTHLAETLLLRNQALPPCDTVPARAHARCEAVHGKSWADLMRWLKTLAEEALTEMQVDALHLPAELQSTGDYVLAHERALIDFAKMELDGRSADSLRPIQSFLTSPSSR